MKAEQIREWGLVEEGPTRFRLMVEVAKDDVLGFQLFSDVRRRIEAFRAEGASFTLWRMTFEALADVGFFLLVVVRKNLEANFPAARIEIRPGKALDTEHPWTRVQSINKGSLHFRRKERTAIGVIRATLEEWNHVDTEESQELSSWPSTVGYDSYTKAVYCRICKRFLGHPLENHRCNLQPDGRQYKH
jgi:hypothetical protein